MPEPMDITWYLEPETITYPDDPRFECEPVATIAEHGYSMRRLSMSSHAGTHVDAPAHFFDGGLTVDEIPLSILCGDALVLDVRAADKTIDAGVLRRALAEHRLEPATRLLLRTTNEDHLPHSFTEDYAHLTHDAAVYLTEARVRLIGIDYVSIETGSEPSFPAHRVLLGHEPPTFILEGLDLRGVPTGEYELTCLPLRIRGGDGAPARVLLRGRH